MELRRIVWTREKKNPVSTLQKEEVYFSQGKILYLREEVDEENNLFPFLPYTMKRFIFHRG